MTIEKQAQHATRKAGKKEIIKINRELNREDAPILRLLQLSQHEKFANWVELHTQEPNLSSIDNTKDKKIKELEKANRRLKLAVQQVQDSTPTIPSTVKPQSNLNQNHPRRSSQDFSKISNQPKFETVTPFDDLNAWDQLQPVLAELEKQIRARATEKNAGVFIFEPPFILEITNNFGSGTRYVLYELNQTFASLFQATALTDNTIKNFKEFTLAPSYNLRFFGSELMDIFISSDQVVVPGSQKTAYTITNYKDPVGTYTHLETYKEGAKSLKFKDSSNSVARRHQVESPASHLYKEFKRLLKPMKLDTLLKSIRQ